MSDTPAPTAIPKLDCRFEGKPEKVFVGDRFEMLCTGYDNTTLADTAHFEFKSEDANYTFYLFSHKKEVDGVLRLQVTTYKAGDHKDLSFTLSDGLLRYEIGPLNLQVQSVLKQGEEPKPAPSIGPLEMPMPIWYWGVLGASVLILFGRVFYHLFTRMRRKRLMEELQALQTMLPAFGQFSKDMRVHLKQIQNPKNNDQAASLFAKLNEDFRLYLVRELQVPAHKMSRREIMGEIKESHRPLYKACRQDLEKLLLEFEKGEKDDKKIKLKDCEQVLVHARKVSEKIHFLKVKK